MPEETRVFDVARPGHSSPTATSKPIIVGHHPTMSDPMMRDDSLPDKPDSIRIAVQNSDQAETPGGQPAIIDTPAHEPSGTEFAPSDFVDKSQTEESVQPSIIGPDPTPEPEFHADSPVLSDSPLPSDEPARPSTELPVPVEGLHLASTKRRKNRGTLVILSLLVILVAAYLLIDAGIVKTGINLPFHIFKQKTAAPAVSAPTPASTNNQASTPSLPAGFTEYKLADTAITFAAPTDWGTPVSTSDPGFSARGGTNKSDGVYAYLVDFGTNKDVQIAVTSSKYLPVARGALYYDFLQWCIGTVDSKTYLTTLHFSTANKVDTPTTTACDQGPLGDTTKLNSSTIVQLKTKSADGKDLGDLYTENLQNTALPVMRVKDTVMTNGDNIKKLLDTVKTAAGN